MYGACVCVCACGGCVRRVVCVRMGLCVHAEMIVRHGGKRYWGFVVPMDNEIRSKARRHLVEILEK